MSKQLQLNAFCEIKGCIIFIKNIVITDISYLPKKMKIFTITKREEYKIIYW